MAAAGQVARYELRALPADVQSPCHGCGKPAVCRVAKLDGTGGKTPTVCDHVWCGACGEKMRARLHERRRRG